MILWLDDIRNPNDHGFTGCLWAKTYDEAIVYLQTGEINLASLDHDLTYEQMMGLTDIEKTGYDVICWMEENNVWPKDGVLVHSANPSGKAKMLQVVQKHYGKIFQFPWRI